MIGVAIDSQEGKKVNRVLKDKPAESAGMKDGDVILKCSGITLRNREALVKIIQAPQDQPLTLMVQRRKYADDGKTVQSQEELEFTVKAIKNETARQSGAATPNPYGKFLLEHLSAGNSRPTDTQPVARLPALQPAEAELSGPASQGQCRDDEADAAAYRGSEKVAERLGQLTIQVMREVADPAGMSAASLRWARIGIYMEGRQAWQERMGIRPEVAGGRGDAMD